MFTFEFRNEQFICNKYGLQIKFMPCCLVIKCNSDDFAETIESDYTIKSDYTIDSTTEDSNSTIYTTNYNEKKKMKKVCGVFSDMIKREFGVVLDVKSGSVHNIGDNSRLYSATVSNGKLHSAYIITDTNPDEHSDDNIIYYLVFDKCLTMNYYEYTTYKCNNYYNSCYNYIYSYFK